MNARRAARRLLVPAAPALVYFGVRPAVASDAAALAVAGAAALVANLVLPASGRRVDPLAVLTAVSFALACVGSLPAAGNPLPLKLHEAAVTFLLGLLLLAGVLVQRPLPIGRYVHLPHSGTQRDMALSALIGSFLVLHSLLHLALAMTLSTADYVTVGRAVNLATFALGAACLYAYVHRAERPRKAH